MSVVCLLQTHELDAYLVKNETPTAERLLHREVLSTPPQPLDASDMKTSRRDGPPSQEDLLVIGSGAVNPISTYLPANSRTLDEDVFLRPALWEDIESSIQKLDPENAEMLAQVKLEPEDSSSVPCAHSQDLHHSPPQPPVIIKTEKSASVNSSVTFSANYHNGVPFPTPAKYNNNTMPYQLGGSCSRFAPPPTPPMSDPGSPGGGSAVARRTPPPPYPLPPPPPPPPPPPTTPTSTVTNGSVKYNRRNNPELEKRRIHHCDFPGK